MRSAVVLWSGAPAIRPCAERLPHGGRCLFWTVSLFLALPADIDSMRVTSLLLFAFDLTSAGDCAHRAHQHRYCHTIVLLLMIVADRCSCRPIT